MRASNCDGQGRQGAVVVGGGGRRSRLGAGSDIDGSSSGGGGGGGESEVRSGGAGVHVASGVTTAVVGSSAYGGRAGSAVGGLNEAEVAAESSGVGAGHGGGSSGGRRVGCSSSGPLPAGLASVGTVWMLQSVHEGYASSEDPDYDCCADEDDDVEVDGLGEVSPSLMDGSVWAGADPSNYGAVALTTGVGVGVGVGAGVEMATCVADGPMSGGSLTQDDDDDLSDLSEGFCGGMGMLRGPSSEPDT